MVKALEANASSKSIRRSRRINPVNIDNTSPISSSAEPITTSRSEGNQAQPRGKQAPRTPAELARPTITSGKRKHDYDPDSNLDQSLVAVESKRKKAKGPKQPQQAEHSDLRQSKQISEEDNKAANSSRSKDDFDSVVKAETPQKTPKKRTKITKIIEADIKSEENIEKIQASPKRKRKTKEEKEAEAMPLADRTKGLKMFIGAHVSCAKGVQNSVSNSVHIGANAFAMFLKSQRKWENPPLQDLHRDQFKSGCLDSGYDAMQHVLPHGSYLVNLAQAEPEKAEQAYQGFIDDLHRCDALGIKFYNFHPGTTGSHPRPAAISRIASALNRAHSSTQSVVPVLETMATAGSNVIGSSFEDIRDIIAQVHNKERIGVCLDTCHVFAAGYDLRQPKEFKETIQKFDEVIGINYLKALHMNDSKAPLGAGRDLHQNIGLGFLGLRAFHNIVNESRFENLPLILETPIDSKDASGKDIEDKGVWAREIKLLESLVGMDANSKEFKDMEESLAAKGAEERKKYQEAFQRKKDKLERGQSKLKFGKRSKAKTETDDSGNED